MKSSDLVKQWNECEDAHLASFIKLLRISDIVRERMFLLYTGEGNEKLASPDAFFEAHLKKIESHNIFKLLQKDNNFLTAYGWLDKQRKFKKYKTAESKIRILESVIISFTVHARISSGKQPNLMVVDTLDAVKQAQVAVKNLLDVIQKSGRLLESPLLACCDQISEHLYFIKSYKPEPPLRRDNTRDKRAFINDLVAWLIRHDLQRSPKLIGYFVSLVGDKGDPRNLVSLIRKAEGAYNSELQKMAIFKQLKRK